MAISVLIADDHGVLRAGLRALLSAEPDLEVVGQAADGKEAVVLAEQLHPDVLLADINMPGATGIEVARALQKAAPTTRVLILTMYEDTHLLDQALQAGARGYIAKRVAEAELIAGVRAVAAGQVYIQADLRAQPAGGVTPRPVAAPADVAGLSAQEKQMLALIARGATNREIAGRLGLELASVEELRASLGDKLGLHSRIELIRFARENALL